MTEPTSGETSTLVTDEAMMCPTTGRFHDWTRMGRYAMCLQCGAKRPLPGVYLRFRYVNHRGDEHEYVVQPQNLTRPDVWWSIDADVVTRDGDPREELGDRRRTFRIDKMRDVESVVL